MKKVLFIAVIMAILPFKSFAANPEHALEGRTLYRLEVEGLVCAFCAYSVEQKLQAIAGVEYVDVDIDSGIVLVGVKPEHELNENEVRRLLEAAGFRFKTMERRPMTREELEDGK